MFGMELPTLPVLYMLAGLSQCMPQAPPAIDIKIVEVPLEYSFDVSLKDLTLMSGADNLETGISTFGMTASQINVPKDQGGFKINGITDKRMGTSCLWFDAVRITLEVGHHVYISKEVQNDECIRQAVLEHELEHVKIDFALLKKHVQDLRLHLKHLAVTTGTVGPVPAHMLEATQNRMKHIFVQKVVSLTEKFREERLKWQATIDSPQDKELLLNGCLQLRQEKMKQRGGR